jgi:GTPase SAR1 family protein
MVDTLELSARHLSNDAFLDQALNLTEAAILVYDIQSRESFDLIKDAIQHIRSSVGRQEYGLLLVGNKSDCEEGKRQVSWADGQRLAMSFTVRFGFLETSAKMGDNIDKVFPQLGREVLKLRWLLQQRREQSARQVQSLSVSNVSPARSPRWKNWTRPWFHRMISDRKTSQP